MWTAERNAAPQREQLAPAEALEAARHQQEPGDRRTTATMTLRSGGRRVETAVRIGTNTTSRYVMNAELVDDVYCRPTVWNR